MSYDLQDKYFMDMSVFAGYPSKNIEANSADHIFIVSYQLEDNMPLNYIVLKLIMMPEKISIKDEYVCYFPDEYPQSLKPYLLSLFNYKNKLTSVLISSKLALFRYYFI